ncbi:MAG: ImmA/IrrE family metallo-endopeptidase, partial [Chloroflexi bacterium]|nr:ImmA/IrrE family metallo-endopeptidase [Chloroflexota bacterium]
MTRSGRQSVEDIVRANSLGSNKRPVDVFGLAAELGVRVIEKKPISSDAMLIHHGGEYKIVVNDHGDPAYATRQRFSIAHELGHLLLQQSGIEKRSSSETKHRDSFGRNQEERMCDQIAAEILMPKDIFINDGNRHGWTLDSLSLMSKDSTTLIGIDTGGTFSDFVYIRNGKIRVLKILSTPKKPGEAILTGIKRILSRSAALEVSNGNGIPQDKEFDYSIIHGSTVATNAHLERKGARTALITTKGFKDILEIGRQNRAEIYNIYVDRPQPLIPSSRRFEINERTLHDGSILK